MNTRETGEKGKGKGADRHMLAQWLRESDKDGPYTGIWNVDEIAEPTVEGRVTLSESTTSSLEYFDPTVEARGSHVQEKVSSPLQTETAGIYPHQDILAFCGSWQSSDTGSLRGP